MHSSKTDCTSPPSVCTPTGVVIPCALGVHTDWGGHPLRPRCAHRLGWSSPAPPVCTPTGMVIPCALGVHTDWDGNPLHSHFLLYSCIGHPKLGLGFPFPYLFMSWRPLPFSTYVLGSSRAMAPSWACWDSPELGPLASASLDSHGPPSDPSGSPCNPLPPAP